DLSERAWGTVREDYSPGGTAWDYVPHDHARSRAYRWNEDGIAGISDRHQKLCFALALWNRRDPILKERIFGLTGQEGNHGEDVKELYYYLDSTPTHSYMKYLYKYPQAEFPYAQLLEENRRRGRAGREYELIDTGVFEQDRYFDVFVEYAKADVEDLCIRIEVANRGPEAAAIDVLPTLWLRNTWSWGREQPGRAAPPVARQQGAAGRCRGFHPGSAQGGSGRVLRLGDPDQSVRRRPQRHAPGARGDALVEAVLSLRRARLVGGRSRPAGAATGAEKRPKQRLGAPLQRRRSLHAGQVGVSLFRGLGSRL